MSLHLPPKNDTRSTGIRVGAFACCLAIGVPKLSRAQLPAKRRKGLPTHTHIVGRGRRTSIAAAS